MPLFRENMTRSAAAAAGAAFIAHFLMMLLPNTVHAFNLMQSSVAMLALASLAVLIVTHHNREGEILTRAQEEWILIGAFGVFWFAVLVAMRAFGQMGGEPGSVSHSGRPGGRRGGRGMEGFGGRRDPYRCDNNAAYCVVEEWDWY